jgi:N-methylhydantoinase A
VLSANGAATLGIRRERLRSLSMTLPVEPELLAKVGAELAGEVAADLAADGVQRDDQVVELEADLRFKRQTAELTVPLSLARSTPKAGDLGDAFRAQYAARYGSGALARGAPVELVMLRAVGRGPSRPPPRPSTATTAGGTDGQTAATARPVRVDRRQRDGPPVPCRPLDGVGVGTRCTGPIILDGRDTTVWVPAGMVVSRDERGMLVVEAGG